MINEKIIFNVFICISSCHVHQRYSLHPYSFPSYRVLQVKKVKARRHHLPMAILPAPFLSDRRAWSEWEGSRGITVQMYKVGSPFRVSLRFYSLSSLLPMLRSSAAAIQLRRQINGLQARSDDGGVVFGVGAARLSYSLYSGSVMFYGGGGMRSLFPYFCEREGLCDGILDVGVDGGWWVPGSSVLRSVAADLCSTLALRKMTADGHSSSKVRLGVASRRRFLRIQHCVASLIKIGVEVELVLRIFRRAEAPTMSLELLLIVSKFVRVFYKVGNVMCFLLRVLLRCVQLM
jgi:hypothetical protein